MSEQVEKCTSCGKPVVMRQEDIPATWLAAYSGDKVTKVIHVECAREPENKRWWEDEEA